MPLLPLRALLLGALLLAPGSITHATPTDPQQHAITPEQLLEAFETVEAGVRELSPPFGGPDLPGVHLAAVTLRFDGRVLARAASTRPGLTGVRDAATKAIEDAAARLSDRYPFPRERLAIAFAPSIAIELELAGKPTPIALDTSREASIRLSPGVEGLLFRSRDTDRGTPVFPGEMRAGNTEPSVALQTAVERALRRPGLGETPLRAVLDDLPEASVSRFRTAHAAQTKPTEPPRVLHRGGRVVPPTLSRDDLVAAARSIDGWLARLPDGARTYDPISTRIVPTNDPALTVQRWYARTLLTRALDPSAAAPPPPDAALREVAERKSVNDPLPLFARQILGDDARPDLIDTGRRVGIDRLTSTLPWLGLAALASDPAHPPLTGLFLEHAPLVDQHTLRGTDLDPEDRDLLGGVVFTSRTNPLPDWQAARVVAFDAVALGNRVLTPLDRFDAARDAHLERLRFLLQLITTEAEAHAMRSPTDAIGGVRSSLWNASMPVEASCLTLIAIAETIRVLDENDAWP